MKNKHLLNNQQSQDQKKVETKNVPLTSRIQKLTFYEQSSSEGEMQLKQIKRSLKSEILHNKEIKTEQTIRIDRKKRNATGIKKKCIEDYQQDQFDEIIYLHHSQLSPNTNKEYKLEHQQQSKVKIVQKAQKSQKPKISLFDINLSESEEQQESKKIDNNQSISKKQAPIIKLIQVKNQQKEQDDVNEQSQGDKETSLQEGNQISNNRKILHSTFEVINKGWETALKMFSQDFFNQLFLPLPGKILFQFEIHRSRNFIDNSYQFWVNVGNSLEKLLTAETKDFGIQSKTYYIFTDKHHYAGSLISDFKRQQYVIRAGYGSQQTIIGTISSRISINNYKRMELYTPEISTNNQFIKIYQNNISNNLRVLAQIPTMKQQVKKYRSISFLNDDWEKIKERQNLKQSKKNILLINQKHHQSIFIGKKSKDRCVVYCLSPISPIQLFGFAIVQLQR